MNIKFYDLHEENFLLFVYGTLKKNYKYNHMLCDSKMICERKTLNKYPMIDRKYYPYVLNDVGNGYNIKGELYRVSDSLLNRLDIFEGSEYIRKEIKIKKIGTDYNTIVDAYIYFLNPLNNNLDLKKYNLIEKW